MGKKVPHLAAVIVGNDGASLTYVRSKSLPKSRFESTLLKCQVTSETIVLKDQTTKMIILMVIYSATSGSNRRTKSFDGSCPSKDVDGFHPGEFGKWPA
jgi:methylenetetrahydrofolate dehydrogenase (NADP+)/methenyltetrahydrofolate cyclohydrolase